MRYMAIDQFGETYHGLTHPRRDLMERLGRQRASKMYRDKADGSVVHCGYIVAGRWCTLYSIVPFEKKA